MIAKKLDRKRGVAEVTFTLPSDVGGETVHVVGDFNEWQNSHPMKKQKAGNWKLAIELEPDAEYQFRYLVNEQRWLNDPEANGYAPNPFGQDNSVVRT